jgi:hypothetical protein
LEVFELAPQEDVVNETVIEQKAESEAAKQKAEAESEAAKQKAEVESEAAKQKAEVEAAKQKAEAEKAIANKNANESVSNVKKETVEFAHRFLFATYDLGFTRVDFCNGKFTTNDSQIINALRSHPDMGQELVEIGKKV